MTIPPPPPPSVATAAKKRRQVRSLVVAGVGLVVGVLGIIGH